MKLASRYGAWLREPLLHFLLLGSALFVVYGLLGGHAKGDGGQILISQGHIEQLRIGFERTYQRAPDAGELEGMIDDAVREEIYYREAKALGLDQDDSIIRRRLRQKLEFVSEDVAPIPDPTEAQLEAFLRDNPQGFQMESRYSLTQLYLDPAARGSRLMGDAQALLVELRSVGPSAEHGGDTSLMQRDFERVTADELSRLFGEKFETALRAMPIGEWSGPLASGYGLHLVLVRVREPARTATLREKRDDVRREWLRSQRERANASFYADLRKRYEVTVARPATSAGAPSASGVAP